MATGPTTRAGIQLDTFEPTDLPPSFCLWSAPGCIAGDARIRYVTQRADGQRSAAKRGTMKSLWHYFHAEPMAGGRGQYLRPQSLGATFFVQSVDDDDRVFLNQINDVVDKGLREVFRITTRGGWSLKATGDHEVKTRPGSNDAAFTALERLHVGDAVYVNPAIEHRRIAIYAIPDPIVSIEHVGVEQVYDIVCADPYRNFVASGIVVHNCGKSTMAAALGSRILYVQTRPDALRMAFDLYKRGLAPRPPIHRVTLDENFLRLENPLTPGHPYGSNYAAICSIVTRFIQAVQSGVNEYDGIIFDEWSTILDRVWIEMAADPWGLCRSNKNPNIINIFAVMDRFRAFHSAMISVARQTRLLVGFISHYQLPTYYDDGPLKGEVKTPGGPKVPDSVKAELNKLCAEISAVLEVRVEKPSSGLMGLLGGSASTPASGATPLLSGLTASTVATPAATPVAAVEPAGPVIDGAAPRVMLTNLEPEWFRKITGYGVKAREPLTFGTYGLREVLEKAGFPIPKS